MRLYHGSKNVVEKPIYGFGKKYNDYGLGFYCTEDIELAKEWAVDEERDGYANIYDIEENGMTILNLNSKEYTTLHWLEMLLCNRTFDLSTPLAREARKFLGRNFHINTSGADIIRGYRADDSYFSFVQDFINGNISYRQLCNEMRLGNLGEQVVLVSPCAFESIRFINYEKAFARDCYRRKYERDYSARRAYFSMDRGRYIKGDIYIYQIIDEEMREDDSRLQ